MTAGRALRILLDRTELALGSLVLVEKQLLEIRSDLTTAVKTVMIKSQGDEEENSEQDFFISPPLYVYEGDVS
jgi:hypothetical protein